MYKYFKYIFSILGLYFLLAGNVNAGITERTLLDSLDLTELNERQQTMFKEELTAYATSLDQLAQTDQAEWKKKVKEMLAKIRDGLRVYKLARDNSVSVISDEFEKTTKTKVYVLTYVEDGFLNNIFYRLAEAFYETIRPNSFVFFKYKFNKAPNYDFESPSFVLKDVKIEIAKAIKYKVDFKLTEASAVAYRQMPASKDFSDVSTPSMQNAFASSVAEVREWLRGAQIEGAEDLGTVSFLDPAGNVFGMQIGGPSFKILSAVKNGPIISFLAYNEHWTATFTGNNFNGYQNSKGKPYAQENSYAGSIYLVSGYKDGNDNAAVTFCNIPVEYSEEEKTYKGGTDQKLYGKVPTSYLNQPISAASVIIDDKVCTVGKPSLPVEFNGNKITVNNNYSMGDTVVTLITAAITESNKIAQLETKYNKVKPVDGVGGSFAEDGHYVSYDKSKNKFTAKVITSDELRAIKTKIENGQIDGDSEVLIETEIINGTTVISVGALGYNASLSPKRPNFNWSDQNRKVVQVLQKNKINKKLEERKVIDITAKTGGSSSGEFPDKVKTVVKDLSWFETISQITKESKSFIEDCKIPERMYDPASKGYKECIINTSPYFSGAGNGVVDEVASIPQMIILATDIVLHEEVRAGLVKSFQNLTLEKIQTGITNTLSDIKENITSTTVKANYQKGLYTITVVASVWGASGKSFKDLLKKTDDGLADNVDEVAQELGELEISIKRIENKFQKINGNLPLNAKDAGKTLKTPRDSPLKSRRTGFLISLHFLRKMYKLIISKETTIRILLRLMKKRVLGKPITLIWKLIMVHTRIILGITMKIVNLYS